MYKAHKWKTLGVLAALVAAIAAPYFGSGLWSLRMGVSAIRRGDYLAAAPALESAARKLVWRPELWESAGTAAYSAGEYGNAARLLSVASRRGGLSASGWEVIGSSMWEMGYPTAALAAWEDGSNHYPRATGLLDRLAAGYHELGDYEAEKRALTRRLKSEESAESRYRLGLLLMLSDPPAARIHLDAAARLDPDVRPASSTLNAAIAAAAAQTDKAASLVVIGRSLGLVEEWNLAARAFSLAVEADRSNPEAHAWLGEARQHIDQDGKAELDAALSLGHNNSVAHTLAGLYWRRQGNLGLSLAEYSRAAQLEPQSAALQSLLGEAYAASGDLVSAIEAYQAAVDLAPSESSYWRLLAQFCANYEVQVLDLGVAAGLKAVELAPRDPQALDALGWAYAQAGYLSKAEKSLLAAVKEEPDFALSHLHLGLTYMRWGQNDLALQQLSMAAELDANGTVGQSARDLLRTYFPQSQ
ncbi:MAG TPA: tetratricopeptide repeat protein [Anaerolineales bacterium]